MGLYDVDLYEIPGEAGSEGSTGGDVVGPAVAVDSDIAEFDGTDGKKIKDGGLSHTNVADAVTKKHSNSLDHARQHAITATADHTSTITSGKMVKADASGLPAEGTNTDTDVADAVSKRHSNSLDHSNALDHTQGTDQGLDTGGANAVVVADVKDAVTKKHDGTLQLAKTALPAYINPKAMAQGVRNTYVASGASIMNVPDNANMDVGINNFTLNWRGILPDWTPSVQSVFLAKYDGAATGYMLYLTAGNSLQLYASGAPLFTSFESPSQMSNIDGQEVDITAVYIRESVSVAGSVLFYINGVLLGSVVVGAAAPINLDNTDPLYILGGRELIRNEGICKQALVFNRALTAAEVLDLYVNGINSIDKWGSQTSLSVSTILNHDAYSYNTFDGASATGFHVVGDATGTRAAITPSDIVVIQDKKYRITFSLTLSSGTLPFYQPARIHAGTILLGAVAQTAVEGNNEYEFTCGETLSSAAMLWFTSVAATEYTVSNLTFVEIGATLALEPEGIQADKWYDSSTNTLDASYPTTGWSLIRKQMQTYANLLDAVTKKHDGTLQLAKTDLPPYINPKAMAQGVELQSATGGGIWIADNTNIDFGIGNFSVTWRGSLPNWALANTFLVQKANPSGYYGWFLIIDATGTKLAFYLNGTGGAIVGYTTTKPHGFVNGTEHEITVIVNRETVSVAGSVAIYVDGVLFETAATIAAGSGGSINVIQRFGILEFDTSGLAGKCSFTSLFNRALTAAEVLDLYMNGINAVDKWGNQTSIITGDDSTFASDTGWWTKQTGATIADGVCHFTAIGNWTGIYATTPPLIIGRKYRINFTISNYSSGGVGIYSGGQFAAHIGNGTYTEEFIAGSTWLQVVSIGTSTLDIDNITCYLIGATLALEPEGIQRDKWYDSSSNFLDASYPVSGYSLIRKTVPNEDVQVNIAKGQIISNIYSIVGMANINGLWVFDKNGSTPTIPDRSGRGHDITLRDAALSAINASTCKPGISGLAPHLTSDATHVWDIPDHDDFSFPLSPCSIIYLGSPTAGLKYFINKGATSQNEWFFYKTDTYMIFIMYGDAGSTTIGRFGQSIEADVGTVHCYQATYNGGILSSGIKLYRDGIRYDDNYSETGTFTGMENKTSKISNYYDTPSNSSNNIYSVICICSCELTQAQVTQLDYLLRSYAGVNI